MLNNDMKVLLVSDPETEEAAVALRVGVGSYSDPQYLPGLAHCLEHTLLMGSERYPNIAGFPNVVSLNTGVYNAFSREESTNFHFQIAHHGLRNTLDIFASFFESPLLEEATIEKEIQNIHSEYVNDVSDNDWKVEFMLQLMAHKDSPDAKFTLGNVDTLLAFPRRFNLDLRRELNNFYNRYYSANLMSLVVLGKQPL